jgi:predicted DNA-binding protein (MmcQ/YjbR family)
MYSDDDPHLAEVRKVCLGLPEAVEVEAWGRPTWRAGKGKMFAIFEGDEDHPYALVILPEPAERPALLEDTRFYRPRYHGPYGWVGLDLTRGDNDWDEIGELIRDSYRQVAIKRQLKALGD